ncbi:MAG: protein phosphatase 2C domain-containing protein [Caldilineaceae bacterium]
MNIPNHLQLPFIGSTTRTGKRHPVNDDHFASFVVLRENTTRRLARKRNNSEEETVRVGGLSDPGLGGDRSDQTQSRAKVQNESADWSEESTQKIHIAVIADGVTSTIGGGQASQIAVDSIRSNLQDPPSRQETISEWLEFAIQRANEEILFEAKRNPQWKGMSSTVALAALAGEKLYILHLGDSRAYLMRQQQIYQLTSDHTWAQESINSGMPARGESGAPAGSNHLLRYLGAPKLPAVDRGILSPTTDQREEYLVVEPGDCILLCTDGLYRRLSEEEMMATLTAHHGYPEDAVEELVELAVGKGELDDITAILLEIPPAPEPESEEHFAVTPNLPAAEAPVSWLRTALIILFALILMFVVALLVWSWKV